MAKERPDVVSKKPDQHESQLRKLDAVLEGQRRQESITATLADRVARLADAFEASKPFKIEVTCKCAPEAGDGGLTAAQEAEQAAKLRAGKESLKSAVEANQANPEEGA
jgi:hypothetical protein